MKPVGTMARTSTAISAMTNQALHWRDGLDGDIMTLVASLQTPLWQSCDTVTSVTGEDLALPQ